MLRFACSRHLFFALLLFAFAEELLLFDNALNSSLPESLFRLSRLAYLDLSENFFSGDLPSLNDATDLVYFYVNNNAIMGSLPRSLPLVCEHAWLNSNRFTGQIPFQVAGNLTQLLLQNNSLNGNMPTALCSLGRLEADCLDPQKPNYVACTDECCTRCY
mmetsp:Transcript_1924/g.4602  ORF Transcript_1924/g.4602 Transcript_1924/m.4602 type:complete len:160 (-) Transcript_1924:71-550(-)